MTGALIGQRTADGNHIVLAASGNSWDRKQLAARLHMLTALGESVLDENGQKTGARCYPLTWPTIVQLGFIFNSGPEPAWQPLDELTEWIIAETIRRTSPPPPVDLSYLPAGLVPRPYQADGAAAIARAGRYLLGDEPGTGKTVTALLGIEARRRAGTDVFPMVIVVPSWNVADVWDRHIREWMPHWPAPVMHKGPARARVQGWKHRDYILITTYATARRDAPPGKPGLLAKIRAATVVADECHLVQNPEAKQSWALWRIAHAALTMVWASGTMITRDFGDIYQPLYTMDWRSWPSKARLKDRYLEAHRDSDGYSETITGLRPEMAAEFFACVAGQLSRVAKADVLEQLPPKIYSVRRPELPPDWRHAYDTMRDKMLAELPDGGELPVMTSLAKLQRMSQLASSAADVAVEYVMDEDTGLLVPHYTVTLKRPSWKAEALLDIIAERRGWPVIAFAESRQLAMIMGEYCEETGLKTGYIVGTGKDGITDRTRRQAEQDFQAGYLDVIICTAGAGGLGITLTASNTVVMAQRPFGLADAIQPEDRSHRIGQEASHVEIIDLVAKDTVDQYRREVLKGKAGQLSQLFRDPRIVRELLGGQP